MRSWNHPLCSSLPLAVMLVSTLFWTASCETEDDDAGDGGALIVSGLYGPCGLDGFACEDPLTCLPSRANPSVFVCTKGCTPSPKCPESIASGDCKPLNACEEGCCAVNNIWYDVDNPLTCGGAEVPSVRSDGFCQPWP